MNSVAKECFFAHRRQRYWLRGCRCFVWLALLCSGSVLAQPPGTVPSIERPSIQDEDGVTDGLPISGYMFLDSAGNPVLIPNMTFEELVQLQTGNASSTRAFEFKSLKIDGTSEDDRAELDIEVRVAIEATRGQTISIPLQMPNFNLLGAPEFASVPPATKDDSDRLIVARSGGGYVLLSRAEKRRETVVRMKVSARVKTSSASVIEFKLPDVPTDVTLKTSRRQQIGEVFGLGDEVIQSRSNAKGTTFAVESSGGSFQLRWSQARQERLQNENFSVDGNIDVQWKSPDEAPSLTAQLRLRSLRESESISSFSVRLPPRSTWKSDPQLTSSGRTITPTKNGDGTYRITIPENERRGESMDVLLEVQLSKNEFGADNWYRFRIPQIVGALRQEGEVAISSIDDYRLRWLGTRGIQRTLDPTTSESKRSYSFRFDRGTFVMPIRLMAQQQQLRVSAESDIYFTDSLATLDMTLRTRGDASDSRQIGINFGPWRQATVQDSETQEQMAIGRTGDTTQVSLTRENGGVASLISIRADMSFSADQGDEVVLDLPQIVSEDPNVIVESSTVTLRSDGRNAIGVDLSRSSQSLGSDLGSAEEANSPMVSHFRIQPPTEQVQIVGTMDPQQPQITLESEADVTLEGDILVTNVQWTISSRSDLEGYLDVAIPKLNQNQEILTPATLSDSAKDQSWSVTVNGKAADLRPDQSGDQYYRIVSEKLTAGQRAFTIRWVSRSEVKNIFVQSIALPRLRQAVVELRGDMNIALNGNQNFDLKVADSPSNGTLKLGEAPREPIRVRLTPKTVRQQDLTIQKAVIRSAVGQSVRYEQVLASVQGGDEFRVWTSGMIVNLESDARVDGQATAVRRDMNELVIDLPGDTKNHLIDLRVWHERPAPGQFGIVEPSVRLPLGAGRVYWQVVLPSDYHVVWATPTLGRAMNWEFDRWRLSRRPMFDSEKLTDWIGKNPDANFPTGNDYLYVGSEISQFKVRSAGRSWLWLIVGVSVLSVAWTLAYVPSVRNPMVAVAAAVAFAGLLTLAPDAAVLTGQLALVAMVLVIIMFAVRALIEPQKTVPDRVVVDSSGKEPSTRRAESKSATESAIGLPLSDSNSPSATSEVTS